MKTIVITGANSGIGYMSSLQLAKLNHKVIMVCRNENKAREACKKIIEQSKNQNVSFLIADLSDSKQVKETVEKLVVENLDIDVLINNAADFDISVKQPQFNAQGIEKQFATNVVAPFILSEGLMPVLKRANGKIINVSTQGLCVYPNISLDFDNLNAQKFYKADKTYYQNKLALLMFSLYMREKYKNIDLHAVRVTNVKVDISRYDSINPWLKQLYKIKSKFSISPSKMAEVYTALATEKHDGFLYNEDMKEVKANKFAYDKAAQQRLYDLLLGV